MCAACMDPDVICTEHGAMARTEPRPAPRVEILVNGEWVELGGIKPDGEITGYRQDIEPMHFMGVPFHPVDKDTFEITEEAVIRAPFGTIDRWQEELVRLAKDQDVTLWYEHDRLRRVWRFKIEYNRRLPRGDA